ncbi:UPF0481 protein At3g47200 [Rosa chinensis]|nr:UPF0481 protein At3g47200 [Rosa chinensis]
MFKFSGLPSLRYLEILTRMKVDVDNKLDSIPVSRLNTEKEIRVETRICRVPEKLRELKEDAYNPRVVSIGPFHSCKDYLAPMSRHKYYYMSLLIHSKDAENCLDECICAITDFDVVIRQCYVEDISVSNDELRLMMLVDGCFILELLLRLAPNLEYIMPQEYESDPLINNAWMIRALWHDLALLENQIPFFILEKLYDIIKPRLMSKCRAPDSSLAQMPPARSFWSRYCLHRITAYNVRDGRSRIALNHAAAANLTPGNQYWGLNYCAEELVQSGIELFKESEADSLVNITAARHGQLIKIPPLFIDEVRDSLFRNLIAYEQSSIKISHHVTSYVILMKSLIRSPRDVKLLKKKGIISQYWIDDQEYSTYFRSLLDEVFPTDFYFGSLCCQVDAYANKFWFRRKMSALYHTYFSTAWSMTSFIAAICLFILTVLQTYFTINPAR